MSLGTEWVIDATGCDATALANIEQLRKVFDRVIRELDLHVLGEVVWHQFAAPGGVTGIAMLTESHLTCHTYPEFNAATFNLYCCRERVMWPWKPMLAEMLGANDVTVRVCERLLKIEEPSLEEVGQWAK